MFKDIKDSGDNLIKPKRIAVSKTDTPVSDRSAETENQDCFSAKMDGKENSARRRKAERREQRQQDSFKER
jgi:hypothetical protein